MKDMVTSMLGAIMPDSALLYELGAVHILPYGNFQFPDPLPLINADLTRTFLQRLSSDIILNDTLFAKPLVNCNGPVQ
jgi:hypothetical protein